MVYKQYPKVTAKGINNVEKMDQIYNTIMERSYGEWSRFVAAAIFEKWDREFHASLQQQHPSYASLIETMTKINEYTIGRRFGQSITNAYSPIHHLSQGLLHNLLQYMDRMLRIVLQNPLPLN